MSLQRGRDGQTKALWQCIGKILKSFSLPLETLEQFRIPPGKLSYVFIDTYF